MGRIRPSWYYERQAREANAREAFRTNYSGPPEGTTINSRPPTTTVYYRSLLVKDGTDHRTFLTSVANPTLAIVSAASAGLLTVAPVGETILPLRGSGITPSKASWYAGDSNPVYESSDWGTRYARYYQPGTHKSIPISDDAGEFTPQDVMARFNLLFGVGGSARAALGAQNGRAQLTLERLSIAQLT